MDKPADSSQGQLVTPTTTDDESINTSTASDTFDSWTLVTDKKYAKPVIPIYEDESNIEGLPKYEDLDLETSESTAKEEQENEPSPDHHADTTTSATDEFSDEVSIISESESGELFAPHALLREHLQTLNLKFTTGEGLDLASLLQQQQQEEHKLQQSHEQKQSTPPNTPIQLQQITSANNSNGARQRKRRSPSINKIDATEKTAAPPVPISNQPPSTLQSPFVIRRVYTLFFYAIIALTVLGLYGKLGSWPTFNGESSASMNALEKKIVDMELQNNLMRAEIDLLTKQVNYLKSINPTQNGGRNDNKYQPNKEKNPYKKQESIWTTYESIIEDENEMKEIFENAKEPPNIIFNTPKTMEAKTPDPNEPEFVPESIPDFAEQLNGQPIFDEIYKDPSIKYYEKDDYIMRERFNKHNSKEKREFGAKNEEKFKKRDGESGDHFEKPNRKYNSKERYDKDKKEEKKNFKNNSKERFNDNSKERKYKKDENEYNRNKNHNNDSKENFRKKDDSRERKYKKSDKDEDDSKENYYRNNNFKNKEQQKPRKPNSDERFGHEKNNGEWHEKLMQQREQARNERQKLEKNWYLNRNEGREQLRIEELNRR